MNLFLGNVVKACLGSEARLQSIRPISGGDINMAFACQTNCGDLFIKVNDASARDMFDAEQSALQELGNVSDFVVPKVLGVVEQNNQVALILDYLHLSALTGRGFYSAGERLARLHLKRQPYFGWTRDNYIGSTAQPNPRSDNWLTFLIEHRLRFQIELLNVPELTRFIDALPSLTACFTGYEPVPSLLHGDLWSGNIAGNERNEAVIFDPASYYGDREMDLAMTELFGGFPQAFYQGYQSVWPLDAGYGCRKRIYQLYHILNHANLFAGHYLDRAANLLQRLLN